MITIFRGHVDKRRHVDTDHVNTGRQLMRCARLHCSSSTVLREVSFNRLTFQTYFAGVLV